MVSMMFLHLQNPLLALEHFKEDHEDYSLVISDIRMPGLNGFEFAEYINKVKPEIKVILMSAFDINDDNLLSMKANYNNQMSAIIQKPLSPMKLGKILTGTATN